MQEEVFYKLKSGSDYQLVCLPYLGGYVNSYYSFAHAMDNTVEVWASNPPGHGGSTAPPLEDINHLVEAYFLKLKTIIKPNSFIFGHSMGAIVAYFLLQKIINSANFPIKPMGLVLSACNPPSFFSAPKVSTFSQRDLVEHLQSFGAIPEAVTKEKSLIEYYLPALRADFQVLESAALCNYMPLNIPVYYLWGEKDKVVSFDEAIKWAKYFTQEINFIPIANGSHMFIKEQPEQIAKKMACIFDEVTNLGFREAIVS